jgi:hypothetical protein
MKQTRFQYGERSGLSGVHPQLGFAAAILAGFGACAGLVAAASAHIVMPAIATMLLVFAAGFCAIAWRNRGEDPRGVTYADVAGALTLIGLFAAAMVDPDQLLRIVATGHNED